MYYYRRVPIDSVDWDTLNQFADRTVFQTKEWLDYLVEAVKGEPVVAALYDGDKVVGYFTGMIFKKFGLKILGSPFEGWMTYTMGMNLQPGVSRLEANRALTVFAFGELGCIHLELSQDILKPEDFAGLDFVVQAKKGYKIDMSCDEDKLYDLLSASCRRDLRRAEKCGLQIVEATDDGFADDYYDQVVQVFAKSSKMPTYDRQRVRRLAKRLRGSGRMLLLRAIDPDGRCIATLITLGMNGKAFGWGQASSQKDLHLFPNVLIFWHAMQYWRSRGVTDFDMGAGGGYKVKFGAETYTGYRFMKSKYPILLTFRKIARDLFHAQLKARSALKRLLYKPKE